MQKINVLIVDDEKNIREVLATELASFGFRTASTGTGSSVLTLLQQEEFDVVLLDLNMPGMGGIEVLKQIRSAEIPVEVVVLTADAAISTAVDAIKLGAYDYLVKPVDLEHLSNVISKANEKKTLRNENFLLKTTIRREEDRAQLIATSPSMHGCLELIRKVANTNFTVLITGESGTGKELAARTIHRLSDRSSGPFIALNCSAIPENMVESELFGYEKGAFTGAHARKPGLLELAGSGTLFLDEIGDMPLPLQVKLLRVIESGRFYRLGGTREMNVDIRIVSATNSDLAARIGKGAFRGDFFYRISGFAIVMPALRERQEDIPLLIEHIKERNQAFRHKRFSPKAMHVLIQYGWPGNVRELQNVIHRVLLLSRGEEITARDLPSDITEDQTLAASGRLKDIEREHILKTLSSTGGHLEKAAAILGIHAKTLRRKLAEYGVRQ